MLLQQSAKDPAYVKRVLEGVNAYRAAPRRPRPPDPPVIASAGRARLLDYGGEGRPVVFVPSLINPPYVLDLSEENSLLRWLATQGVRPMLLDWGNPAEGDDDLSVAGHVESLLLPMIDAVGSDVVLAGYCLGGTMALAAAALRPVAGVVLIAAPWRFSGYGAEARGAMQALWDRHRDAAALIGLFPMEALQSVFWQLDPVRSLEKYAAFGEMDPETDAAAAFVQLEDWVNDGPPLTLAAARELLEDLFVADVSGAGAWRVDGEAISPASLQCPILNIISSHDRIVPAETAAMVGERRVIAQGHVGMVVGSRAKTGLWQPLGAWLSQVR